MLFPESTPARRVQTPEEKARADRRILELQIKHDRLPEACRGPIAEELAKLSQRRALDRVAGERKPTGLGLALTIALLLCLPSFAAAVPIDVYLGPLGQSNAVGKFGPIPGWLNAPQQHEFRFWVKSGDIIGADTRPLSPMIVYGGAFGAELSFGKAFTEKIAVIKVAKSGSAMAEWERGAEMYTTMQAEIAAGLADLVAKGYEPTIRGATWIQGEYDSGSAATAAAYESRLTQLIADLRTDYGQDLRFVYNQLHADLPNHWPSMQWVGDIRQAQLNVAASVPNVRMINVDALQLDPRDNLHFSPAMQDTLGQWQAKAFLSPADLNYDGAVDGADFLAWQRTDGTAATLAAWTAAVGSPAVAAVPEPTGAMLLLAGVAAIVASRSRRAQA